MTDDEIIKALESCTSQSGCFNGTKNCPLEHYHYGADCPLRLGLNALDLINRQKAEIDRLKNELHGKVDYIHEQREIIDDLKDKYNKKELTVEVAFDKDQLEKIVQDGVKKSYELQINEIRNEAIREFAEFIKEKSKMLSYVIYSKLHFSNTIDTFVKEMTEKLKSRRQPS